MRFIFIDEFIQCSVVTAPCCCCNIYIYIYESIIPNDDEKEAGVGDVLLQSLVLRFFSSKSTEVPQKKTHTKNTKAFTIE